MEPQKGKYENDFIYAQYIWLVRMYKRGDKDKNQTGEKMRPWYLGLVRHSYVRSNKSVKMRKGMELYEKKDQKMH